MKRIVVMFLSLCLLASATTALAGKGGGGKRPESPDGAVCRADKDCAGKVCVKAQPKNRTGICCTPTTCEQLSATCGSIDSCGTTVVCGECALDENCGGDGWRCAYNSFDGTNRCVNVTGYCPN